MIFAYAIHNNYVKSNIYDNLNLNWFYGCYLDGEFELINDDYDQFLMDRSQINFIRNNYKNGGVFKVRVIFGKDDYKDGLFYYWWDNDLKDRGLIATKENKEALEKFNKREKYI